jgi:hypothetical protein
MLGEICSYVATNHGQFKTHLFGYGNENPSTKMLIPVQGY